VTGDEDAADPSGMAAESERTSTSEGGPSARARRVVETGLTIYRVAEETQVSLLAAAIAYYAFVSMVPLVVLGVTVATTVGAEAFADQVLALTEELLTPEGETLLRSAMMDRTGLGSVTVIGLAVLLWGALRSFRALDRAFALVYGTGPSVSLVRSIGVALLALTAVGAGIAATVVVGAAVSLLPGQFPASSGAVTLFLTLFVLFLPLYFLFPDVDLAVRDVLPGATLAALGWTVLGSAFQLYAAYAAGASIYGLLGAVLLVLAWFYFGALILLLGATLNAVRSGHAPDTDQ